MQPNLRKYNYWSAIASAIAL